MIQLPDIFGILEMVVANFYNLSSGDSLSSYLWNFDDGSTSNDFNPSHSFVDTGKYSISLVVSDQYGCKDTLQKDDYISNNHVEANFSVQMRLYCPNSPVLFTNNSINSNNYFWNFNDNHTSTSETPTHSFSTGGTYSVELISTNLHGCRDTVYNNVNIDQIKAGFMVNDTFLCSLPDTIHYKNKSENAVRYEWYFGDGDTSFIENPINIITQKGYYSDTLYAYSSFGCVDMFVSDSSTIALTPRAYFMPNNLAAPFDMLGCVPLTINFEDKSIYDTPSDEIVSWLWDFGDGQVSSAQNPSHIFTSLDTFLLSLTVTTRLGCSASFYNYAKTGTKQHANFTYTVADTICASEGVQFYNTSEVDSLVNFTYWIFSDSTFSTRENPLHFFTDTGYMDVKLLAYNNGCPDDTLIENLVYVNGPYHEIEVEYSCSEPYSVTFFGNMIDVEDFYWNFGDGSDLDSVNINPTHEYSLRGTYTVTLETKNQQSNCNLNSELIIDIYDAHASFTLSDTSICVGDTVWFNAANSINEVAFNYQNETGFYLWDYGNGSSKQMLQDSILMHKFIDDGDFDVKLKISDKHGCIDSTFRTVHVHKPNSSFYVDNQHGCTPFLVDFVNTSSSTYEISSYQWNFGDNSISLLDNPSHLYDQNGVYSVNLIVIDEFGCTDTLFAPNYIATHKPVPDFFADQTNICSGSSITFSFVSQMDSITDILWDFGDGFSSNEINPTHLYSDSGKYTVSLSLSCIYGCDSIIKKNNYISVQNTPQPSFIADTTFSTCYPLVVNFENKTQDDNITSYYWDFGNNTNSTLQNPACTYLIPDMYDVKLTVVSSNGCSAELIKDDYINVKGPYCELEVPDTVCIYLENEYNAVNQKNVYSSQWFFGDGGTSFDSLATYSFTDYGTFYPILLLKSDDLNTCNKFIFDTVHVRNISSGFIIDSMNLNCTPFEFIASDTTSETLSRIWDFGDNSSDSILSCFHTYNNAGTYKLTMYETDIYGCMDTVARDIIVHPLPIISANRDTFVCLGSEVQLTASGANTYSWFPSNSLSNSNISNPISDTKQNITYNITGADTNGCINYATTSIEVIQPPVFNVYDTTIVVGDTISFNNNYKNIASYQWSPNNGIDCDTACEICISPLTSTTYTLVIKDTANCFELSKNFMIDVLLEYSVDVPSAFTPNGDHVNDKIFVDGWGIQNLIYFNIFNRYGELVFSSTNLYEGWDGTYKSKDQPVDTYIYQVSVMSYDGKIRSKSGTIKLIH